MLNDREALNGKLPCHGNQWTASLRSSATVIGLERRGGKRMRRTGPQNPANRTFTFSCNFAPYGTGKRMREKSNGQFTKDRVDSRAPDKLLSSWVSSVSHVETMLFSILRDGIIPGGGNRQMTGRPTRRTMTWHPNLRTDLSTFDTATASPEINRSYTQPGSGQRTRNPKHTKKRRRQKKNKKQDNYTQAETNAVRRR